jgi:purine-binding chemotaxis protein CheW
VIERKQAKRKKVAKKKTRAREAPAAPPSSESSTAMPEPSSPSSESSAQAHVVARRALDEFFVTDEERAADRALGGGEVFTPARMQGQATADLLAFWVADEEYAAEIVEIQEIIKVPELTEVPRAPAAVLGIISLRGTIVPVVDLRTLLYLPRAEPTRAARVLVLRGGDEPVGMLVDRVSSVVRLDREAIEPVPRTMQQAGSDLLQGVGRDADRMLIVLNLEAILTVLEAAA